MALAPFDMIGSFFKERQPFWATDEARPPVSPNVRARLPAEFMIKDFVDVCDHCDQQTAATVVMNHDNDTLILLNSYETVTAHFHYEKIIEEDSRRTKGYKRTKKVEDFDLVPGQMREFRVEEWTEEHWILRDEKYREDVFVTLLGVTIEDPDTGGQETEYTVVGARFLRADAAVVVDWWRPKAVINRVRGRRMIIGPLSGTQSGNRAVPARVVPCPQRRQEIIDMTKEGRVSNPVQAGMIYAADVYEDARARARQGLRPY